MTVKQCLQHKWMSQDVKYMRAKRLSTAKHKRFMARRKWQVRDVITRSCCFLFLFVLFYYLRNTQVTWYLLVYMYVKYI